jgi:hypothetical protein
MSAPIVSSIPAFSLHITVSYNVEGSSGTPTCRVSGYPWQVIRVRRCLDDYVFSDSATNSYNTYNNYTTRHNTTSWYIFFRDDVTPLVHLSSLMTAVRLSLWSWLTPLESDLNWLSWLGCFLLLLSSLLPSLFLMSCIVGSYREHTVQRLRCGFNALIVVRTSVATSRPTIC